MNYTDRLHRIGRIWTVIATVTISIIPVLMCAIYKTGPNWKALSIAWLMLTAANLPVALGEVFTYSYMLGVNGTYLAFITGNLSNLKIPCVINAINIAETKYGTEENEIVSTISIAVSAIVTVVVIAIGVILFAPLQPFLSNPKIQPAFDVVVFALFGALGGKYLVKNPKIALLPAVIMITLCVVLVAIGQTGLVKASYMVFVGVILCFFNAKRLAKKEKAQAAIVASNGADTNVASVVENNSIDTASLENEEPKAEGDETTQADGDSVDEINAESITTIKGSDDSNDFDINVDQEKDIVNQIINDEIDADNKSNEANSKLD